MVFYNLICLLHTTAHGLHHFAKGRRICVFQDGELNINLIGRTECTTTL